MHRPKNWTGQPDYCAKCLDAPRGCYLCTTAFEAGADAMLKHIIENVTFCDGTTETIVVYGNGEVKHD